MRTKHTLRRQYDMKPPKQADNISKVLQELHPGGAPSAPQPASPPTQQPANVSFDAPPAFKKARQLIALAEQRPPGFSSPSNNVRHAGQRVRPVDSPPSAQTPFLAAAGGQPPSELKYKTKQSQSLRRRL
eukprot:TRINITY_DN54244_c0_g1_i8.p1 TRINITY_DN54244_c0_g1~~TRINITY_DN54244_c0_g1_i8.p1  ORF type:complete len:130 (-),score=23.69 TRINITY_DN54244_c0_g1_i8:30-419(-)